MTEITMEMNLKKIIEETREVAQALNEFADEMERIEKKYAESQEVEGIGIMSTEEIAKLVAEVSEKKTLVNCDNCFYLKGRDRYCSLLQTNFIPENYACNKGERK